MVRRELDTTKGRIQCCGEEEHTILYRMSAHGAGDTHNIGSNAGDLVEDRVACTTGAVVKSGHDATEYG